jgi:tetratricopeptide (TPR) repeat protein
VDLRGLEELITLIFSELFRSKLKLLAALLLVCLSYGCGNNMQRAAEFAAVAERQLADGDIAGARYNTQQAIATRDDVPAYYILLGRIEMQAQKPVNAFNAYSLALDLEADNVDTLQNIANLGLQIGRVKEAKEAADRILLIAPASPGALVVKGFLQIDGGKFDDARDTVLKIFAINPEDEGGVILSARIDALQGHPQQALARIEEFVSAVGETGAINVTRLEIYRMLGASDKMRTIFPAVLETTKGNFDYKIDYINLLYRTGAIAQARQESMAIINNARTDQSQLDRLAKVWIEHDNSPLPAEQVALLGSTGTRLARLGVARFFLAVNKADKAKVVLAQLVSQQLPEAVALLARSELQRGQKTVAYQLADKALLVDARNEDALLVRSDRNLTQNRLDRAIEDANIVVSEAPQTVMGYVQLGMDALPQSLQLAAYYKEMLKKWGDTARIVSLDRDVAHASPSSIAAWSIFDQSCASYSGIDCVKEAELGLAGAKTRFMVDDPPGTPRRRGLFSRLTPDEACTPTGKTCEAN